MKKTVFTLLTTMVLASFNGFAQNYTFSKDSVEYRALTDAQVISTDPTQSFYRVPLRATFPDVADFYFFGKQIKMDSITVGPTGYVLFSSRHGGYTIALDPCVFDGVLGFNRTTSVSYGTDEVEGKKFFVIQWRDLSSIDVEGKYLNFQLRIEEGGDNVHFHYGPTTIPRNTTNPGGIQTGAFLLDQSFNVARLLSISGNANDPSASQTQFAYLTTFATANLRYNLTSTATSSVSEGVKDQLAVRVFPNPTTDNIQVDFGTESKTGQLDVLNSLGAVVHSAEFENQTTIALEVDAPAGVYFVRLYDSQGRSSTHRIIKQD